MTNEQKHEMLTVTNAALSMAASANSIARKICGIPDNCCLTGMGWMAWDDSHPSKYGHSSIEEGPEVAVARAMAMKEAAK